MGSDAYFKSYGPIQQFKHALLRRYLQAWFAILGHSHSRILYAETHAGRGTHETGHEGSPLVALRTLLDHSHFDALAQSADIDFLFMERDTDYFGCLNQSISQLDIPPILDITVKHGDFAESFKLELERLFAQNTSSCGFVFLDPFIYSIPHALVSQILQLPRSEALVTLMTQDVITAAGDARSGSNGKAELLNNLFGSEIWRSLELSGSLDKQNLLVADLYAAVIGAKWHTKLLMEGQRDYYLIHFTNSDRGRDEMKEAMWRIGETVGRPGEFMIRSSDNPDQGAVIRLDADIRSLVSQLRSHFGSRMFSKEELVDFVRGTDFLCSHGKVALESIEKQGQLRRHQGGPLWRKGNTFTFAEEQLRLL